MVKISTILALVVAAVGTTPVIPHGIPHDHILTVNTQAEYDEIVAEEHRRLSEAHSNLRARILQETGTTDSQPILADYFGGEPGFYHGVGKLH